MPDTKRIAEQRIKVIDAYVQAFEDGDVDAVMKLYAEDATVEDPYGTEAVKGHEAICSFYTRAMLTGARLSLDGPVRVAGDIAAFPFTVYLSHDGSDRRLEVIDTFRFNAKGKIVEMRAFWGPINFQEV